MNTEYHHSSEVDEKFIEAIAKLRIIVCEGFGSLNLAHIQNLKFILECYNTCIIISSQLYCYSVISVDTLRNIDRITKLVVKEISTDEGASLSRMVSASTNSKLKLKYLQMKEFVKEAEILAKENSEITQKLKNILIDMSKFEAPLDIENNRSEKGLVMTDNERKELAELLAQLRIHAMDNVLSSQINNLTVQKTFLNLLKAALELPHNGMLTATNVAVSAQQFQKLDTQIHEYLELKPGELDSYTNEKDLKRVQQLNELFEKSGESFKKQDELLRNKIQELSDMLELMKGK